MMKRYSGLVKVFSVLLILFAVLFPVASVSAALRICRTDPLVYFKDGHKLSVTASVSAASSDITQIVYTVHAPVGSEVSNVIHTAGGLGLTELVDVIADQPEGVYVIDTIVYTRASDVDVTVSARLISGVNSSVSGHAFEHLLTTITDLNYPGGYGPFKK